MGTQSMFWLFALELTFILVTFTDLSNGASDCVLQGCLCIDNNARMLVDCSSKGLTTIPLINTSYSNKRVYELRLNNNNITILGENILQGIKVTKLDLNNNPISSVHNNTFGSLGLDLETLILSGNSRSPPPNNSFYPLTQLKELTLSNYVLTELTEPYFLAFSSLRHLTLDNWAMVHAGPDAFQLPSNNFLLSLTLLNQPLSYFPIDPLHSDSLNNLQKLRISGTHINRVTPNLFIKLNYIQELDLSGNYIDTLERDCFKDIGDTLLKLYLSTNLLRQEACTEIKDLLVLEVLDLSYNSMTIVPNLSQLGTTKKFNLYLNSSRISYLAENSFVGIGDKLHFVNLSQNEIKTFHDNSFNGATALEVLDLSLQSRLSNPLVLPSSLAQSLRTLKQLYVGGQRLSSSELWSLVDKFYLLEILSLTSAWLGNVPNTTLINLTSLKTLDLSYNGLNEVTQATLAGPRSLSYLSLTGNSITKLSSCVFYQHTSYPIDLAIGKNRLICDCTVKWLWDSVRNKSINFIPGQEAICSDNITLASKKIEDFCNSIYTEPQCFEYYIDRKLSIYLENSNSNTVIVSWGLSDIKDLKSYTITVTNSNSNYPVLTQNITSATSFTINNLTTNIQHEICVTAFFYNSRTLSNCSYTAVNPSTTDKKEPTSSGQEEIGIIVGAVVGSVVLLAILAAIIYLVIFRRKPKEKAPSSVPVQPRNFSKSELPSMNDETRTFSKPRKPREVGVTEHREGMQVVAISDGQTGNGRVGRAHLLNSDGSFKTSVSSKPSSTSSVYENDHGLLPPIPHGPHSGHLPAGYYNQGFRDDNYDQIGHGKESTL